jgi:hypothetical protein
VLELQACTTIPGCDSSIKANLVEFYSYDSIDPFVAPSSQEPCDRKLKMRLLQRKMLKKKKSLALG